jgi:RND family efflux transporter MFP subunit
MQPLRLRTAIQEKLAASIRPGQRVAFEVEAFPGRTFDAEVEYVGPAVDQGTRTFGIEARVDNRERLLKPGFFAKGTVTLRRDENVMAVPDAAVSTMAGVATVFIVDGGKVRREPVTLGVRQGDVWEVASGLSGGETLAASNLVQLATGKAVRVTGSAQPAAAP